MLGALASFVLHDVLLFGADLAKLLLVAALAVHHALAAQVDEIAVIAGIFNNATLIHFNDAVHHCVQETSIMADYEDCAGILIGQEIL